MVNKGSPYSWAVQYGTTGDGREVTVFPRMFNTIITIGPVGQPFFDDEW